MSDTVVYDPIEEQDQELALTGPERDQIMPALRNVVVLLQQDPANYQRFGVWWWVVKRLLKRAGYTNDNLQALGNYFDPETAAMIPPANLENTLGAAFQEYGLNARFPRGNGMVEAPDGEIVRIWDGDVGL